MQTEQIQETKTSNCTNWSSFSSEWISFVWRENSLELHRRTFWSSCLRKWQDFTIQTTHARVDFVPLPRESCIYYPEIIVACLMLLFLPFVLSFIAPVVQLEFIDFTKIFKTVSEASVVSVFLTLEALWSSWISPPVISKGLSYLYF